MSDTPTPTEQASAALLFEQNIDARIVEALLRKLSVHDGSTESLVTQLANNLAYNHMFQHRVLELIRNRL
jgi:hypothetical protein